MGTVIAKEDLWKLRQEIVLNSLYYSDYRNSFGITTHSCCDFFDGYIEDLKDMMIMDIGTYDDSKFSEYDNAEHLEQWYYCFETEPFEYEEGWLENAA